MFRRRFSKRPAKGRKRVYKRRSAKGNKLVTKAQLYKAIRKNEETKMAYYETAYTRFNSGISSTDEYYYLLPNIASGNNASERIGDSIRPVKLVIRGVMSYSTNTNDINAHMVTSRLFCFQQKGVRDAPLKGLCSLNLLQNGAAGVNLFTGALLDITRPQNTDTFTYYGC